MMRVVRDEMIWLRGAYRFRDRESLDRAVAAARRLVDVRGAAAALAMRCDRVDDATLRVFMRVPFFDEGAFPVRLFTLLDFWSTEGVLVARVDVD
jgi:hypothetical protein